MKTAQEFFEKKKIDTSQIVCYYVKDGVGDAVDFDPIKMAEGFGKRKFVDGYEKGMRYGVEMTRQILEDRFSDLVEKKLVEEIIKLIK